MINSVLGVVLAGGLATRMGGVDKGLLSLGHYQILDEVLRRLSPQVDCVVINANGDPNRFKQYNYPIIADTVEGHLGPLAGVLSAMKYATAKQKKFVATVAVDTPFFPLDFVDRCLAKALEDRTSIVLAASYNPDRELWIRQPTFGLWDVSLSHALEASLEDGVRKIIAWTDAMGCSSVNFPNDRKNYDPFFNVNTPRDLALAKKVSSHK